jgi:hypothetical protein
MVYIIAGMSVVPPAPNEYSRPDLLIAGRWPSVLCTAFGVIPIFLIGLKLRARSLAYPAVLLYALHPLVLLHGRRASLDGFLILSILILIYWVITMIVAEHSAKPEGYMPHIPIVIRYALLGIFSGTTLALGGVAPVTATILAILFTTVAKPVNIWRLLRNLSITVCLMLCAVYFVAGITETIHSYKDSLSLAEGDNPPLLSQEITAIVTQPFLTPPQYNTVNKDQIEVYERSSVDGWQWGTLIGVVLTLLATLGLAAFIKDALNRDKIAWAILIWTGATMLASLAISSGQQREYLPLVLVAIVLAAEGLGRLFVRRTAEEQAAQAALNSQT